MKFQEIQQPCKANNYEYIRKEYEVDFAWKEVENTEIGNLPNDVFIYDLSDKDLAVYQEKVVTVVEEECKYLNYDEIAVLHESLRDKVKEKAIALVAVASALTLGVLSWGACHPEKTPGELLYPNTSKASGFENRLTHFKVPCNKVEACALRDVKAFQDIIEVSNGHKYFDDGDLVDKVCKVDSFFGEFIPKECKAIVEAIEEKANDNRARLNNK